MSRVANAAIDRKLLLAIGALAFVLLAAAAIDRQLGRDAPFPPGFEARAPRAAWCADRPQRALAGVGFTITRWGANTSRGTSVAEWIEGANRFEFVPPHDTSPRQQLHELVHFHRHDTPDSGHPTYVVGRCPELGDAWY